MFRKIRSDRPPGTTLGGELRRELSPFFKPIRKWLAQQLKRYPKVWFGLMICSMLGSGLLAFTVLRAHHTTNAVTFRSPVSAKGMGSLATGAITLQYLWQLQRQVEALARKPRLDHTDSVLLQQAFAQMDSLRSSIHAKQPTLIQNLPKTVLP